MPSFPQCYGPHAHRDLAIKNATRVSVSFAQFICQTSEGHRMEMEETGHALFDSLRTSNVEMPCWKTPVATWSLGNVWMPWGFGNTEFCSQRVSWKGIARWEGVTLWKGLKGVGVALFECCEVPHPRKDGQETKKLRRCVTLQILLGWHWIKSFIGSFNCATPLQGDPRNRFRRSCALNSEWKTNCEQMLLAADVRCAVQQHLRLKKERHSRHIGTRQYRSPEVVLGLQWDEKTDAPRTFEKGQFLVSGRR